MNLFQYLDRRLYAPAETDTGGGTGVIDGGLPHEHDMGGDEPDEPAQSPEQKRIAALEAELNTEKTARQQAADDAKFWAERGRRGTAAAEPGARVGEQEHDESELTEAEQEAADFRAKMTPEQMLELFTTEGPKALEKMGFVTAAQLRREVAQARQQAEQSFGASQADLRFEQKLTQEFPQMVEDSNRVAAGGRPQTTLFVRAGEIYREAVELDPQLKGSKSLLLTSTRQAAAELGIKAGTAAPVTRQTATPAPGASRRERIAAQQPSPAVDEDIEGGERGPSQDALQVAKMLGVSPKELSKHAGGERSGRRGRS